ncbi:MAG: hypothetical protein M0Z37_08500, partial [Nitrospiraceae bacterium]|nr:hypothetical protein [Nitrospiraceae bacterium]
MPSPSGQHKQVTDPEKTGETVVLGLSTARPETPARKYSMRRYPPDPSLPAGKYEQTLLQNATQSAKSKCSHSSLSRRKSLRGRAFCPNCGKDSPP